MIIVGASTTSGRNPTVLDLIKGALRLINVLTGNTTLTDSEAQDAFEALNWMLDAWSNDPQAIYRVPGFTDLTEEVMLPPGYADAILYNLAIRLAPEYQVSAGSDVIRLAFGTLNAIKRTNSRALTMAVEPALHESGTGQYVVYSDSYR
jgi:hypothetical protein